MNETKILDERIMGHVKLLFIEKEGKTIWAPAYVGNFTLDLEPTHLGEYYAAFMVGMLDYAVSQAPEPVQNQLEEVIRRRFSELADQRYEIVEKKTYGV